MRCIPLLALALACTPVPDPPPPDRAPGASGPLVLGLAGAPMEMFGEVTAPTFAAAFTDLSAVGFDTFLPLFLLTETADESTYTDHGAHFLSPTVFGVGDAGTCRGGFNPYAAAGDLQIVFPGLVLLGLQDATVLLDTALLDDALRTQAAECWPEDEDRIASFYTYDEPALVHAVAGYLDVPSLLLENLRLAQERTEAVLGLPTLVVEGAGPFAFAKTGLPADDIAALNASFDEAQGQTAPFADLYGFDIYPVPNDALTLPGEFVREARSVVPGARAVSVLQGFGFAQISNGVDAGRLPTREETLFMAVDSIVAGADELYWYGASSLDLSVAEENVFWQDLASVATLLAPLRTSIEGDVAGVSGGTARGHQTEDGVVVFVSQHEDTGAVRLTMDAAFTSAEAIHGAAPTVDDKTVELTLDRFDVAIFRLR